MADKTFTLEDFKRWGAQGAKIGGSKGGRARARKLSAADRKAIARAGGLARWRKADNDKQ